MLTNGVVTYKDLRLKSYKESCAVPAAGVFWGIVYPFHCLRSKASKPTLCFLPSWRFARASTLRHRCLPPPCHVPLPLAPWPPP
ncbi:unnamed protein product, partial [Nesidiocoris tenuis]